MSKCPNPNGLINLICQSVDIVNLLIGVTASLALLVFMWGIVKYIASAGGDGKVAAKNTMVMGVVALFVLFSVFGLVRFLQSSFGLTGDSGTITPPAVKQFPNAKN